MQLSLASQRSKTHSNVRHTKQRMPGTCLVYILPSTLSTQNLFKSLSTAYMSWPALKAWPSKHSKQIAGGTVLKRKTTKDHKGHQLQVRLHKTQPACITCQGRLSTCSAGALTRHCFPHLVQVGNPCFAMAWKLYVQMSHHPLPCDSSGSTRPQSQILLIAM